MKFYTLDNQFVKQTSEDCENFPENYTGIVTNDMGGEIEYYVNGRPHREDGPAYEDVDGEKRYMIHGKLHRLDGPAEIWSDGTEAYWIHDVEYTKEKFDLEVLKMKNKV